MNKNLGAKYKTSCERSPILIIINKNLGVKYKICAMFEPVLDRLPTVLGAATAGLRRVPRKGEVRLQEVVTVITKNITTRLLLSVTLSPLNYHVDLSGNG